MELEQVRLSADQLRHLSTTWSPWLDICHFILSTLAVREEVSFAFSRYLGPEMVFLDISLAKDSSLLLPAIYNPFYWQILMKTIPYSGFKNTYKKSSKQEKSSLFMNSIV